MTTVSVVIPTRNRRNELLSTVQNVLTSTHEDLVLHVFDNASSDGTQEAVLSLEDDRIEYRRSEWPLSVTDSFEAAYGQARADWITGLGSDDGFARCGIGELVRLAIHEGLNAAAAIHSSYHWPGVSHPNAGLIGIRHVVPDRVVESRSVILEALSGMSTFQTLPTAYKNGVVSRRTLDELRRRNGRLFRSWNPDVYLGFSVARVVPRFALSGRPLTISGTSLGSTGRNSLGGGADQAPADEFFSLSEQSLVSVHPRIASVDGTLPRSLQVMTLEAFLQSGGPSRLSERFMSHAIVQSAIVLGGRRTTTEDVRSWLRRFVVKEATGWSGELRWAVANQIAKAVKDSYRVANRLNSHGVPKGLAPIAKLSVDDHALMVRMARSSYGVHLSPAPPTLHEAARLLDVALDFDTAATQPVNGG